MTNQLPIKTIVTALVFNADAGRETMETDENDNDDEKIVLGKISDKLREKFMNAFVREEAVQKEIRMLVGAEADIIADKKRLWKEVNQELEIPSILRNVQMCVEEDTGEISLVRPELLPHTVMTVEKWLRVRAENEAWEQEQAEAIHKENEQKWHTESFEKTDSPIVGIVRETPTATKPVHYYMDCNLMSKGDTISTEPLDSNCPGCNARLLNDKKGPKA